MGVIRHAQACPGIPINVTQQVPIQLRLVRLKFGKTIVIFEISTFKLVKRQSFVEKKNGCSFKKLLPYLMLALSNFSNWKISCKNKNKQIWKQKCLTWVLSDWNLKKLLSYLKSAPSNLSKSKNFCKTKNLQIWDYKRLIWVFLRCNFEKILSYLKSANLVLSKCKVSY